MLRVEFPPSPQRPTLSYDEYNSAGDFCSVPNIYFFWLFYVPVSTAELLWIERGYGSMIVIDYESGNVWREGMC